ncbi:HEPN domain-containing protein [Peribacillus butanolivorans]|uniref:HEPN domain-containing protein n=1 Tax=Peribacillus butanolivorans TaxID=421767 RepID=UPI0039FDA0E8
MTEKEIYKDLAERFIYSAEQHINNNVNRQEVVAFKAYHAFESIASAYLLHYNQNVSTSHPKKLLAFLTLYKKHMVGKLPPLVIAQLVSQVVSVRNNFLYPIEGEIAPKDFITLKDASDLSKRIKGVITKINKQI